MRLAWAGTVPVAMTPQEHTTGLSESVRVPRGTGMLFLVYPGELFTMEPMKIPLDMIWIRDHQVIRIDRNLAAGSGVVLPPTGATALLEVGAGDASFIRPGATVVLT